MRRTMRVWCSTDGSSGFGRALVVLVFVAGSVSCALMPAPGQAQAPRSPTPEPVAGAVRVETVARGLEHPWALAFLPDGRLLVTERPGRLRIVDQDGRLSAPLASVPPVRARGGDELNRVEAGKNYGWPVIGYGTHYWWTKIGEGTAKPGMEQPVYYWDPVIAPSGMAFYTGAAFPGWRGNILIGSLRPGLLVRLTLEHDRVTGEERYLAKLNARIRDVRQGPDGLLYLLTDHRDGRLLRVLPAAPR